MINIFFKGFITSASLIIAIGSQNAFVLRQGLLRSHIFIVCILCFLIDASLMSIGIFGSSSIFQSNSVILLSSITGAIYLAAYGFFCLYSAIKGRNSLSNSQAKGVSANLYKVIITTLIASLLNPHVYFDTIFLVGSIASTIHDNYKLVFWIGCCCASISWFFSLGYASNYLSSYLTSPKVWRIIEGIIALAMFILAFNLGKFFFNIIQNN